MPRFLLLSRQRCRRNGDETSRQFRAVAPKPKLTRSTWWFNALMTPIRATPSAAAGSKGAKGEARPSVFQGRFLTLRLGRIDQRHILKLLDRELIDAGRGVALLQRGHSSGSGEQHGRMRPQHGGRGGE